MNKIVRGVYVYNLGLEGHDIKGTVNLLRDNLIPNDRVVVNVGKTYTKELTTNDVGFEYLYLDTAKKAFSIGRTENFIQNFKDKIYGLNHKIEVKPLHSIDTEKVNKAVLEIQNEVGTPLVEPHFVIREDGTVDIVDGSDGYYLDVPSLSRSIEDAFDMQSEGKISVDLYKQSPVLDISDLDVLRSKFKHLYEKGLKIKYGDNSWSLSAEQFSSLVVPTKEKKSVVLTVSEGSLRSLVEGIASEINRPAKAQKLEIVDGEVKTFESSEEGLIVNVDQSMKDIKDALLSDQTEVKLSVIIDEPPETENEYGIKDLLGIGKSTFHHSSSGRIHNIGLAASRVSGTLVPPGEVFSFNNAVGEISRRTGYTSAWVISKGRTVLGDGGGVCQVSTTLFRAALNAGLPIVERKAHSYRVGYYEQDSPPGIDATIYSPSVDLKFKNDTDHYILIVADFDKEAQSLDFRIFGTKDNRVVKMTKPTILSRTAPPPPVYEDDPTLPKGTLKRVESPVAGANVVFSRTVEKDGKVLYDDTFRSNYRAWGAVYKRGTKE